MKNGHVPRASDVLASYRCGLCRKFLAIKVDDAKQSV
jgi:hypothetical protein